MLIMTNVGRILVYAFGLILVIAALWYLYTSSGLTDVIPEGVAIAVLLLILGIGVMAAASQIRGPRTMSTEREVVHDRPLDRGDRVVEERRYDDERL